MLKGRLALPPAVLLASSVLVSASSARMTSSRLETIAKMAEAARPQALRELAVGQKTGHWIWWLFPTLAVRGGDMFSMRQIPGGADLQDPSEAASYIAHEGLRAGLLKTLKAADAAFATAERPAPYNVLDKGWSCGDHLRSAVYTHATNVTCSPSAPESDTTSLECRVPPLFSTLPSNRGRLRSHTGR